MLATVLAIWLACPPTAEANAAPKQPPWRITPASASVYHHLDDIDREPIDWSALAAAPIDPPEIEFLPLWDLPASMTALESAEDTADKRWLRWVLEAASGRPERAHAALLAALRFEGLSATRLLWWRAAAPPSPDTTEALLEAHHWGVTTEDRTLLATALALAYWELSCPVTLAPDGACRVPGASTTAAGETLLRREPINVERARHWTAIAMKLHRKAKFDPEDLAAAELFAELTLAAQSEEYEALLSARMPEDLSFVIEDWRHKSGVLRWERLYERQVAHAEESRRRMEAFYASYGRCWSQLYKVHGDALRTSARVATLAMLREATILFEAAAAIAYRPPPFDPRGWWRCDGHEHMCDHAIAVATRCVMTGNELGGDAAVVEACRAILDVMAPEHDPLLELIPEPRSTSVMQTSGVLGPEWL